MKGLNIKYIAGTGGRRVKMEQRKIDEKELMKLKDGNKYIIPESDYGRAEIWYINNCYFIFSIPQYGGCPCYETVKYERNSKIQAIERVLDIIYSWT